MSNPVFEGEFFDAVLSPEWIGRERFRGADGFSFDTRTLRPGEIFVALQTGQRDGHKFIKLAEDAGAAAAIVSSPVVVEALPLIIVPDTFTALQSLGAAWRKRWGGRAIGVTGSCGKTSTKELLGLLLGKGETYVTPGNLNNLIGVPLSLLQLRSQHRKAVIEAGINEGGEMVRLAGMIDPEIAVVTTIGPAHLEKLGSLEGIAKEKARLPASAREAVFLGPACSEYTAFTEARFPGINWLVPGSRSAPVGSVGRAWRLVRREKVLRLSALADGTEPFEFVADSATPGMIENMALAVLVARMEGVPDEVIRERLGQWRPASQRGEILEVAGRKIYADHYNANPASFADAIAFFHHCFPESPRCWVIGAMEELGQASALWHRNLAEALPVGEGDRVFLVGELAFEMAPILMGKLGGECVRTAGRVEEVVSEVCLTNGTIFLKGSRMHKLEKILDSLKEEG